MSNLHYLKTNNDNFNLSELSYLREFGFMFNETNPERGFYLFISQNDRQTIHQFEVFIKNNELNICKVTLESVRVNGISQENRSTITRSFSRKEFVDGVFYKNLIDLLPRSGDEWNGAEILLSRLFEKGFELSLFCDYGCCNRFGWTKTIENSNNTESIFIEIGRKGSEFKGAVYVDTIDLKLTSHITKKGNVSTNVRSLPRWSEDFNTLIRAIENPKESIDHLLETEQMVPYNSSTDGISTKEVFDKFKHFLRRTFVDVH